VSDLTKIIWIGFNLSLSKSHWFLFLFLIIAKCVWFNVYSITIRTSSNVEVNVKLIKLPVLIMLILFLSGCTSSQVEPSKEPTVEKTTSTPTQEPTPIPESELISLDEEWNQYINRKFGFRIKVPKQAEISGAECVLVGEGESAFYTIGRGTVPVVVLEGEDRVFITSETWIELGQSKTDPSGKRQYPNDLCEIVENTPDMIMDEEYWNNTVWEIAFLTIKNEVDLETLVDSYFFECFSVGEIKPDEQYNYSWVKVEGDGKPVEESKCLLRGMYVFLYSPEHKIAATWKTGQSTHFNIFNDQDQVYDRHYDGDMLDSFEFIPRQEGN
jgi:hypothetical protein